MLLPPGVVGERYNAESRVVSASGVAIQGGQSVKCVASDKGKVYETLVEYPRIADSSSKNAVNFSSACTTKRFPSSRCASAIQIVRPLESIAETQTPTPTGFAEIVSDDFPILHVMSNVASFRRTAWLSVTVFSARAVATTCKSFPARIRKGAFENLDYSGSGPRQDRSSGAQ